jgi:carbon starvation protein CstA
MRRNGKSLAQMVKEELNSTAGLIGTVAILAIMIILLAVLALKFPAVSRFIDGSGPVVAGKLFPFCFITIACGAISGFHTLISSGTTPKIITRESYARSIGYGAMCLESLVAIMALIAACSLEPGSADRQHLRVQLAGAWRGGRGRGTGERNFAADGATLRGDG